MKKENTIMVLVYNGKEHKRYLIDIVTKKIHSHEYASPNPTSTALSLPIVVFLIIVIFPIIGEWVELQGLNNLDFGMKQLLLLLSIVPLAISILICAITMPTLFTLEEYAAKHNQLSEVTDTKKIKEILIEANKRKFVAKISLIVLIITFIILGYMFLDTSRFVFYIWMVACGMFLGLFLWFSKAIFHIRKIEKHFKEIK
jgi:hypothetical protein